MTPELQKMLERPTASVEEVGRLCFNLSRNGSYDAAHRGDFPTIKVGRLIKVPTAPLRRLLGLEEVA